MTLPPSPKELRPRRYSLLLREDIRPSDQSSPSPSLPSLPPSSPRPLVTDATEFMAEVGIEGPLKVRKALTEALVLEVGGSGQGGLACLATRLQELATERGDSTWIQKPKKMAMLRIQNVEDSLSKEEIAEAIAGAG